MSFWFWKLLGVLSSVPCLWSLFPPRHANVAALLWITGLCMAWLQCAVVKSKKTPWKLRSTLARFKDVTADQTWDKLNMWQTRCLSPIPLALKPPIECWLFHKHFDLNFHWLLPTHNETFLRSQLASSIYCPRHASFFLSRMSRQTYVATRIFHWEIWRISLKKIGTAEGPSRFGDVTLQCKMLGC
jgi:hypothetical protein